MHHSVLKMMFAKDPCKTHAQKALYLSSTPASALLALMYLDTSVTGLHPTLQLSFPCIQSSSLLAQSLALPCQLSAELAVSSRLRLKRTPSLTQLSVLSSQRPEAPLQGFILLLKLLTLLSQLTSLMA